MFLLRLTLMTFAASLLAYLLAFNLLANLRPKTAVSHSCVMLSDLRGRLGNLMFEYAALYSLARVYGCRAVLLPSLKKEFQGCFNVSMPSDIQLVSDQEWREYPLTHLEADQQFKMTYVDDTVFLTGSPSDWRYFSQFEGDIRREFQFVPQVRNEAEEYLRSVRQEVKRDTVTYVGVHIRRTDYISYLQQYGCVTADAKYVMRAMKTLKNKYPDSLFIVASDDIEWCKEILSGSQFDIAYLDGEKNTACLTMAALSQCNHSIVTQGSYGFWSAYLAGGETVYMTDYCANNSRELHKMSGMHLSHWMGIPAS